MRARLLYALAALAACGDGGGDDDDASLLAPGRVPGEHVLAASAHPQGVALVTRVFLPDGSGPLDAGGSYPVAFGYHGSGGLTREPEHPGDPCTTELESKYQEMTELLLAHEVAVVWVDSFSSRDPRFCEDNTATFRAFAPPVMDGALQQVLSRLLDTTAAEQAFCALARFDCGRALRIGTSEGASAALLPTHRFLDHAFEQLFDAGSAKNRLDELPELAHAPLPAPRQEPRFVFAVAPGCGFYSAIPLALDGPSEDLFYPAQEVHLELGSEDDVPAECAIALGAGRRQLQAEAVRAAEGITADDFRYRVTVYEGAGHPLWEERGPELRAKLESLLARLIE